MSGTRRRSAAVAVVLTGGAVLAFVVARIASMPGDPVRAVGDLVATVARSVGLTDPIFYLAIGAILVFETLRPAVAGQARLGRAFLFDATWTLVRLFATVAVLTPFVVSMSNLYAHHLAFLTVPGTSDLPTPARFVFGILAADLLAWLHHWIRHKLAWCFHAVHHSQPELNLFTDDRNHFVDLAVSAAVRTIPMLMFSVETPAVLAWVLFGTWFTRLYHANIRSNFGWLRYVLVTPQSHRIHHSTDPRHHEKNFGLVFSFWDRLFGTHHPDCDEYPATGIADPDFPLERDLGFVEALCRQQLYPFAAAWRGVRSALAGRGASSGGGLRQ